MFDPYHKWLGIPKDQRPPTYYQLLGISPQEQDAEAIEEGAIRQTAHVRTYQLGPHAEICKRILGEISKARLTLLDAAKRQEYDQTLAEKTAAAAPPPAPEEQFLVEDPAAELIRRPGRKRADQEEGPPAQKAPKKAAPEEHQEEPAVGNKKMVIAIAAGGGGGALVLAILAFFFFQGNPAPTPPPLKGKGPDPQAQVKDKGPKNPDPKPKETQVEPKPKEIPSVPAPKETVPPMPPKETVPPKVEQPKTVTPPDPTPMPTPAKPSPPEEKKRAETPGEDAIKANQKILQDQFKKEYAAAKKTAAARIALAEKLFKLGQETLDDLASRYVLLAEAKELAIQAGQVALALSVTDELTKGFAVSPLDFKHQTLAALAKGTLNKDNARELTDAALAVLPELIAADELPFAQQFLAVAESVAKKYLPPATQKQVQKQAKEIQELVKEFEQMKAATAVLAKEPENAEANFTAGQYLAFRKGEWDKGLLLLSKGGPGPFQDLARQDLAKPEEAKARVALGDLWWEVGDKDGSWRKPSLQWRAYHWYRQALPLLSGLTQAQVAKRVKLVEEQPQAFQIADSLGEVRRFKGHGAAVTALALAPDGKRLVSGSLDTTLRTWDIASGKSLGAMKAQIPVVSFSISPDQRNILVCSTTTFKLLDARTGLALPRFKNRTSIPGAGWLNAASFMQISESFIYVWSLDTGSGTGGGGLRINPRSLVVSQDGSWAVVLGTDGVAFYRLGGDFPSNRGNLTVEASCAAFSPGGKFAALGGKDKTIRLIDLANVSEVKTLSGHTGTVQCLAFSPSGQRLLSGGSDKTVRLWDLNAGREMHTFALHTDVVNAVAFAPDGRTAFSGSADMTVRQWSLPREK